MRKFLPTYFLLLLFLGGLLYYLWSGKGEKIEPTQIFKLDKEKIKELLITYKEETIQVKKDGEWKIIKPKKVPADQEKINNLIEKLANLNALRVLEGEEISKYGLDKPPLKVAIKGEGKTHTLWVGNQSPVSYQFYARKEGGEKIYVISGYIVDDFQVKLEDLREKKIVKFEKEEVKRVALVYPDQKIVMEKEEGEWKITSPLQTAGDKYEIEGLLTTLKDLRVDKFIQDEVKDFSPYGLDKPTLRVELWIGEDLSYKAINLGKEEDNLVFLSRQGLDSVFAIKKDRAEDLKKTLFQLRNKVMLTFDVDKIQRIIIRYPDKEISLKKEEDKWKMEKPKEGGVDEEKVQDLLWTVKDLEASSFIVEKAENLTPYGLDNPQLTLILKSEKEEKKLYLGKLFKEKGEERVYAKVGDRPQVFTVEKYILEDLRLTPEDFLKKKEDSEE